MRHPSVYKKRKKRRADKEKLGRWLDFKSHINIDHTNFVVSVDEIGSKYTLREVLHFLNEELGAEVLGFELIPKEYPKPEVRKIRE